jgi:hypothetical protein
VGREREGRDERKVRTRKENRRLPKEGRARAEFERPPPRPPMLISEGIEREGREGGEEERREEKDEKRKENRRKT